MAENVVTHTWMARVDGEIVGQGPTPGAAVAAARAGRPDHTPTLTYVEAAGDSPLPFDPLLEQIRPLVDGLTMPVYLVGGAVRDAVLQHLGQDLDLVVPAGAVDLSLAIGNALNAPAYVLDDVRDVGRVILEEWQTRIDIARFRGPDLAADLYGRDFTINAMALPATARDAASIIDPLNGLEDIHAGLIRIVHPESLSHDPVRSLRAIRMAQQFGFDLTPETAIAIEAAAPSLSNISPERIRDELVKLLTGSHPDAAVGQMAELGLLAVALPEVAQLSGVEQSPPHHEPVLGHTISVLRWLALVEDQLSFSEPPDDPALHAVFNLLQAYVAPLQVHLNRPIEGAIDGQTLLRFGGLFHDIGKHKTQTVDEDGRIRFFGHDAVGAQLASRRMKRLAFSNEAAEQVTRIVEGHMRPLHLATADKLPSRRAIYRYFRSTHEAGIDIVLLALADHLATYNGAGEGNAWPQLLGVAERILATYFGAYDVVVRPERLVTGSDLVAELGLAPGPEIGRLLREIEEGQAAGQIANRDEAVELARRLHEDEKKPAT